MTAIAKLRDQIAIARSTGTYVVLTADEGEAVVAEVETLARVTVRRAEPPPSRWDDDDHAH